MCVFTWDTAKNAAKFEDTASKLARHVGTSPWPQSLVASKVMSTLKTPEFEEPHTVVTKDRTRSGSGGAVEDNPPVLDDWEHKLKFEEYKAEQKVYNEQVLAWKENKAKCYYLVLSHCPQGIGTSTQEFF